MKQIINKTKMMLLLIVTVCLTNSAMAQTPYLDFIKHASFLKESSGHGFYQQSNKEQYGSPWKFSVDNIKKENGNIVSFKMDFGAGDIITFIPNDKDVPTFWTTTEPGRFDNYRFLVLMKEHFLFLKAHPAKDPNYDVTKWFKFGKQGLKDVIKFQDPKAFTTAPFTKAEITEFLKPMVSARNSNVENEAAQAKAAAEAHKAKYSIKGKEITKIEIQTTHDAKIGQGSAFDYGVVATLKDGSTIKTKNLGGEGYIEDYDITVEGNLESNLSGQFISYKPNSHKGDYVLVSAKSKHHPTLSKADKKVILTYDKSVILDFTSVYIKRDGEPGPNLRIDVKVVNHTETKEEILEYRIYDEKGEMTHKIRLKKDVLLKVISNGAKSQNRREVTNQCGNGGDGGNITLNVDPKVGTDYNFDYSNIGGAGGTNQDNALRNGASGRDGKFTKNVKTVN